MPLEFEIVTSLPTSFQESEGARDVGGIKPTLIGLSSSFLVNLITISPKTVKP